MRFFLEISYKGTNYFGWQIQPDNISIQEVLNFNLSKILREKIYVIGAGRTDTGVHASQMFCHFDISKSPSSDCLYKINKVLPKDITVNKFFKVKENSHTRFDAKSRAYKYFITKKKNPFTIDTTYYFSKKLDIKLMNKACKILKSHKDFECFSKVRTQVNNFICEVKSAKWVEKNDTLVFDIKANRFLRNMVRAIVGTMIDVGTKKITLEEFKEVLKSKNRSKAGLSVPAKGLFLYEVKYSKNIIIN